MADENRENVIRTLYNEGNSIRSIMKKCSCSYRTVNRVIEGERSPECSGKVSGNVSEKSNEKSGKSGKSKLEKVVIDLEKRVQFMDYRIDKFDDKMMRFHEKWFKRLNDINERVYILESLIVEKKN